MSADRSDPTAFDAPFGRLERALIDMFLHARGFDAQKLAELPEQEREALLKEASTAASVKLAEVESRAHYLHEIHK